MAFPSCHPSDNQILLRYGYQLQKTLGYGAFGKVKLACRSNGERKQLVAAKVIDLLKTSKDFKEKFLPREMNIWPLMQHANIIKVYNQIKIENKLYVFMELAEKGDVVQYLQTHENVPEELAKSWIRQLVQALRYCHLLGIAHRDVKCENLLIDGSMNLKLTDFGFARFCMDEKGHRRLLSSTFCGSTAYVAPEVLQALPYNPFRADVWSVGVCLFVMVNNEMPFDDSNMKTMLQRQISRRWSFNTNVVFSKEGKDFMRRVLDPDALKRPAMSSLLESPWLKLGKWKKEKKKSPRVATSHTQNK